MNRTEVIKQVNYLLSYCDNCFLYKHLREENSRTYAHRFCISQCTIGLQLKSYGEKLNN